MSLTEHDRGQVDAYAAVYRCMPNEQLQEMVVEISREIRKSMGHEPYVEVHALQLLALTEVLTERMKGF